MSSNILDGYEHETEFARANNVHRRTIARYRHEPDGLPFAEFGGKIFIHVEGARQWLAARVKRNNPRRREVA